MPRVSVTAVGSDGSTGSTHADYWYDRTSTASAGDGPRLMIYDCSDSRELLSGSINQWSPCTGVDIALRRSIGRSTHVVGGVRGYLSPPKWNSTWKAAADTFGSVSVFNSWTGQHHYDIDGLNAGTYDSDLRALVRSKPSGERWYWTINHEPEFNSSVSGSSWARSIRHFIAVVVDQARSSGIPADELAIGGLVTASVLDSDSKRSQYDWWEGIPSAHLPYVAWFEDTYCKHKRTSSGGITTESLYDKLVRHFQYGRDAGISRFVVGETGISRDVRGESSTRAVGTNSTMAAWVRRELPKCRGIEGLEVLSYFHKPTGPQTALARLEGEALEAFAEQCVAWNL